MILLAVVLVHAQTPAAPKAPDGPPVLLRSTTRLVQVKVVAHNRKGEPVADLKKEDFTIFENKKQQQIAVFSVDSTAKPLTPVPKLPQNIFSNRLTQRAGVPGSVTVLLIDSLNTKWTDQIYARQQLIKFLQQIEPADHIGIYSLGRGLKILHDYTTDSTALLEKLSKWKGENLPDLAASKPSPDLGGQGFNFDLEGGGSDAESAFFTTNRVTNTLKALEAIADHVASVPGRKNLIWLSGGFPLNIGFDEMPDIDHPREQRTFNGEVDRAIRALNNANLAVYPVDARGLVTLPQFSADRAGGFSTRPPEASLKPTVENLDTMEELASRTGGRAAYNTNDLKNAIRRAIDDSKVTYTLGYYSEAPSPDNRFRELKVKVDRPGVNVRYRKGYFALREPQQDEKTRKTEIANAVWSPLDSTAVGMNARVDLVDKPAPNTIHVFTQIDPANVTLTQNGDRWTGKLDILFVQKDAQGHEYGGIADSVDLNVTKDNYVKILKKGIIYSRGFAREPKATALRIIVRDAGTGSTGSLSVPYKDVVKTAVNAAPAKPVGDASTPVN
jgi:VWFA-related protein